MVNENLFITSHSNMVTTCLYTHRKILYMCTKYVGADMVLPSGTVEYMTEITVFCTSLSGEC